MEFINILRKRKRNPLFGHIYLPNKELITITTFKQVINICITK